MAIRTPETDVSPRAPARRRVRMVYLLLGVFALVALAPLCSVAWKLIAGNREALKTSQQEYQLLLASAISQQIDAHVDSLRARVVQGARVLASASTRPGGRSDAAAQELLDALVDEHMLRYVRFQDLKGRVIESPPRASLPPGLEPSFVDSFRRAAASLADGSGAIADLAPHTAPLFPSTTPKRAAIIMTTPVVADGRFLGVVSGVIDLQSVWDAVVTGGRRTGHALFAVDGQGRLFAATDLSGVEIGRDMSDSTIVKRFLDRPGLATETIPYKWSPRRSGAVERYLGSYELSREGWAVFVQAREQDIYGEVSSMIESTLKWVALALVSALIAAALFARVIAEPVNRLANASHAFSAGDYATRVDAHSITEVGDLAETFNHMAAEIEKQIKGLRHAAAENKQLFHDTARALVGAIDAKDPYTKGHSSRVNKYSIILARHYGLADAEVDEIDISSLLHDVGKIGIDDKILKKPGRLDDTEMEAMKKHTTKGEQIMAPIRKMKRMLPGLRSHHERWMGGGYPDNLQGEKIPLIARIIAVADSFDAMTTQRPYQDPMTFDQAHARLNELKGKHFDVHVVEAFNRAYRAGEIRQEETPQDKPRVPEPSAV